MKMRTFELLSCIAISFAAPCQAQPPSPAQVGRTNADPGTEASLRRFIDGFVRNQPDFDDMAPGLADAVQGTLPKTQQLFAKLGALTSLTFKNVAGPTDVYEADFEHGQLEWRIAPARADGKVAGLGFRILGPDSLR